MTDPDAARDADVVVDRFKPTSGRLSGTIGLVTAAVVLVLAVIAWDTGTPLGIAIIACFSGLLVWVVLLRPAVWATRDDLVIRSILHSVHVPLAAIDKVAVTQMLVVSAGGKRYISPTVGYTARESIKQRHSRSEPHTATESYPVFVEARIDYLAQESRDRRGITKGSPEQQALATDVRRSVARLEIAGLAVLAVAFVVWLVAV